MIVLQSTERKSLLLFSCWHFKRYFEPRRSLLLISNNQAPLLISSGSSQVPGDCWLCFLLLFLSLTRYSSLYCFNAGSFYIHPLWQLYVKIWGSLPVAGLRQPELEHLTKHCNAYNLKMLDIRIKGTVIATNENTYIYIYIFQGDWLVQKYGNRDNQNIWISQVSSSWGNCEK